MNEREVFRLTVDRAAALMEEELASAEILLRDLGGTDEEIENAVGPHGFWRRILQTNHDQQIAEVARWLMLGDEKIH